MSGTITKKIFLCSIVIILLVLQIACQPVPEKQCTVDTDCVPTACCHAADTVNKAAAPDCRDIICTMECAQGTLDCGQGEIKCINSQCTAVINSQ